jgi:phosphoribosylanthranilate isomerase
MTVKVKICGLRDGRALDAALDAGADLVGLVFYPPSPRNVSVAEARALVERAAGRARTVALMVDPDDGEIDTVVREVGPDMLQLHGAETPERVAQIRKKWNLPVIKAVRVGTEADARASIAFDGIADMVLFDTLPAPGDEAALPGGNGVPFDWRALMNMSREKRRFILSGGLDPDNVAAALDATGAPIVDVSSGVESSPGEKDPELIRRFIAAAKAPYESVRKQSGAA